MIKVYSNDEASEIKKEIKIIKVANENKKANARRDAEDLKVNADIVQLLNHSDKLYYEGLLD